MRGSVEAGHLALVSDTWIVKSFLVEGKGIGLTTQVPVGGGPHHATRAWNRRRRTREPPDQRRTPPAFPLFPWVYGQPRGAIPRSQSPRLPSTLTGQTKQTLPLLLIVFLIVWIYWAMKGWRCASATTSSLAPL